ncbi:uncharacterized protein LOC144105556 isoform X2 [Amblyomma americanum]
MISLTASLLTLLLVTASAQDPCSLKAVRACYAELHRGTGMQPKPGQTGDIRKTLAATCAKMTLPSKCYTEHAHCPGDVKAKLSSFEDGYKMSRDLVCEKNAAEDMKKVIGCLDVILLAQCSQKYAQNAQDAQNDECRTSGIMEKCAEETFPKSCPADQEVATAFLKRVQTASLLLSGCSSSSQARLAAESFIVALLASIILMCFKSTQDG